ncbi:mitochondrial proton/calcium exchanger protein isoform X2 [Sitodiplosis mosellana]|uniref:mitochondrial proton/calcium exchanger protein isoform X2 n=1 Tax=Sitodiplosis mosellana TaxID=263140 RepID=UPI002443C7E8|nr:mitochondrial proton/calcium exchanger protein isoform X2 [Sitodiplosis mosellana]XP_055312310.1 mitochondrial proton/calcium exchanger protein isoform X2 [Sitodiplosis mosellana]XP_055312311.1 mitochondrial proton/calcium exchanger protein isoform X2 [Sitodiplosis mosellana]XP_055312312.1 mitochondrial proton/calcium exchanger protein isoform X2 [Sitodiplosis mosellana]XP_055312313.1 mitochondrial proton/calcium exchanger protein isoform X2 [Sitodiplosis mosellana]XP_055312314.1 mitochondr
MNSLLIPTCCRQLITKYGHRLNAIKLNDGCQHMYRSTNKQHSHIIRQYSSRSPSLTLDRLALPSSVCLVNKELWHNRDWQSTYTIRSFSLSSALREQASSKVEETVRKLQEKEREEKELKSKATASLAEATKPTDVGIATSSTSATVAATAAATSVVPKTVKKSLKQRVWDELVHYYHGFRLLFINMNVGRKLVGKLLHGESLTRREYRLLIRTTGDMFRLVPFSVFIIVPFMEFLLPVFIKFFPGMLPSTFETASDREKKARNQLKVKLEMAKFLQKTLDEMDMQNKEHNSEEAKDFVLFFNKVRSSGEHATFEEIIKFSKLFEDEITLDSLSRQQLTAICKLLEVGSLGTSNFLRFQLRMKLRSLAADDRMIQREGIDSLTTQELQAASRARGMRAYGLSEDQLKRQLEEWIHLSLNEKVPPSLLLLSRAMMLPEEIPYAEKLKASISSLPDAAAIQMRAAIGEREGKIDNKTQIEIIRDEQRKIKEELEEAKEVAATTEKEKDVLLDTAKVITDDITHKDIDLVSDALDAVSDRKNMIIEKEEIKELKEEIAEYKEDVEQLKEIAKKSDVKINVRQSAAAKRLLKKVDAMISKLDNVMDGLEKEKKLQVDSTEEKTSEELVRIDEVMNVVRKMQKATDQSKMDQISTFLERIDDDRDGQLKVDDVLKIFETIGKENIKLNAKQIDELLDLISKEEYLENEEKIQKALEKSKEEREQRQQEKSQSKSTEAAQGDETLKKHDDEKHILDAEKTPTFDSNEELLQKKISDLDLSEKSTKSPTKPSV